MTLLAEAAKKGDLEEVERQLAAGVDPAANNNEALAEAARRGHLEVVKRLLKENLVLEYTIADYNPNQDLTRYNNNPLQIAAVYGHVEMLEWLLTVPGLVKHAPAALRRVVNVAFCGSSEDLCSRLTIIKRLSQVNVVEDELDEFRSPLIKWVISHGKRLGHDGSQTINTLLEMGLLEKDIHLTVSPVVLRGDIELFERFLERKDFSDCLADPNNVRSLLLGAIQSRNVACLKRVLEMESVCNNFVKSGKFYGIVTCVTDIGIFDELLKVDVIRKKIIGDSFVLTYFIAEGNLEVVQSLLAIPEMTPEKTKEILLEGQHRALRLAAEKGHLAVLYFFIKTYQSLEIELPNDVVVKGYDTLENFISEYEKKFSSIKEVFLEILPPPGLPMIIDNYASLFLYQLDKKSKRDKEPGNIPVPIRLITAISSSDRSQNAFLYAMSDGTQKSFSEAQPLGPIEAKSEQERLEQARIFHIGAQAAAEPAGENLQTKAIRKAFAVLFSEKNSFDASYCFDQDDVLEALRREQNLRPFGMHIEALANLGQLEGIEFQSILFTHGPSNFAFRKNVERFYQQQRKLYKDSATHNETVQEDELASVSASSQSTSTATSILSQEPSTSSIESSSASVEKIEISMEQQRKIGREHWLDGVAARAKDARNRNKDKDQVSDTSVVSKPSPSDVPSVTFAYSERSLKRSKSESDGLSRKKTGTAGRRSSFSWF